MLLLQSKKETSGFHNAGEKIPPLETKIQPMKDTTIRLDDKTFRLSIPYARIEAAVGETAGRIDRDYAGKERPLFVGVLNGSFMYMAELMKHVSIPCEISFVRVSSYEGTASTGRVRELLGLSDDIAGRHVIVVEDIVETGTSIGHIKAMLRERGAASVAVTALLFKPDCLQTGTPPEYCALTIPDRFIVGFGLDYNQLGRNLKDIYEIVHE